MREITLEKEAYFSKLNMSEITTDALKKLDRFRRRHSKTSFSAGKSALLVIDMQEYFVSERSDAHIPSAEYIVDNINRLVNFFSCRSRPVFFTRHVDSTGPGPMYGWWHGRISGEDSLSEISGRMLVKNGRIMVKDSYDSFRGTGLKEALLTEGVRQLVITGVMTHLCCETTARSAFMEGFEVFMPFDATATRNLDFHMAAFLSLSHGFALPVSTDELLGNG